MARFLCLIYGLVAYVLFLISFCYAIGFAGEFLVPKAINDGETGSTGMAILVNVLLLGLFGVQHSIMARPGFKERWTKIVPQAIERSTFVLITSLILFLIFWQWRPLPTVVWHVDNSIGRGVIWALFAIGWTIVLYSSFLIDHFELFGVRQVIDNFRGTAQVTAPFKERSLYRWVRHPLMFGFILAFWAAPTMTVGRLLFCIVTTLYILVAIQLEERDLASFLGEPYRKYRERTPMLIPWFRRP